MKPIFGVRLRNRVWGRWKSVLTKELASLYLAVRQMRVVPFDARSIAELVTSSAAPFAPLLFAGELPDKLKALLELIS